MGSLQDQLLKAGLVSEQKLKESRSDKRKRRSKARGGKPQKPGQDDLAKAYAERARVEQRERDRELNRKREEERQRRERNAQLKQLVMPNSQNDAKAEVQRYFEHKGKIRKIYVTDKQQEDLNAGRLGVAYVRGRYFLVAAEIVERVAAVSRDAVAFFAPWSEGDRGDGDDDYSDDKFQVPDDLVW